MITLAAVLGVSAVALGLVLTPGPNMIYLVSRSVTQGRRAGLVSLAGVAAGFAVYLTAATLGLAAVFAVVPQLSLVLKLGGAAYLGYLAWTALRPGGRSAFQPQQLPADPPRRLFVMGLVTNLLNPKIAILYLAVIPQFVDPAGGPLWQQSLILGGIQVGIAVTVNALIVFAAGSIAGFLGRRPTWLRLQRYLMGTVLGLLAVKLLTDKVRPVTP